MAQRTLMLIEATGIQNYIFGSNELAQHIGASELVRKATIDWVHEHLDRLFPGAHNFTGLDEQKRPIIVDQSLDDGLQVEVVYVGGGNAMLLFCEDDDASRFVRALTREVLEKAPGLHLVVKRGGYEGGQGQLAQRHQDLRLALARRKQDHTPSVPLLGLSVTADCVYTGAPAQDIHPKSGLPIAAEVRAKLDARQAGTQRLIAQVPQVAQAGYEFVYDFDDLGTKGESTYLAVVHADGNRMGRRIQALGDQPGMDDQGYVRALRAFSNSMQKAATEALHSTVELLLSSVENLGGRDMIGGVVPIPGGRLPFRPIVFGGDDVTFVCEGRLALPIAAHYLERVSSQTLSDGELAYSRAGVSVVKSHYPFSRAYDLAEDLCASARARIQKIDPQRRVTALDWHFAVNGLVRSLREIRSREYSTPEGCLLMRPLRLQPLDHDWRTWQTFTKLVSAFREPKGGWSERRNKIIALREALRNGPEAVRHFLAVQPQPAERDEPVALPSIEGRPDMARQGWQGGICGYFDVIEALDFFVPLKGEALP